MMDKPEGIEQRDWDDACEAMDRAGWYMRSVRVECAKAINQARSQAFEEAQKLVMTNIEYFNRREDPIDQAVGAWVDPFKVSQAIRQHSQKGEVK